MKAIKIEDYRDHKLSDSEVVNRILSGEKESKNEDIITLFNSCESGADLNWYILPYSFGEDDKVLSGSFVIAVDENRKTKLMNINWNDKNGFQTLLMDLENNKYSYSGSSFKNQQMSDSISLILDKIGFTSSGASVSFNQCDGFFIYKDEKSSNLTI